MKLILPKLFTIAIFLTLVATPEIAQSKEGKGKENKKDYSKPSEKKYPRSTPHAKKPQRGPHSQRPQRGPQKGPHSQGPQKRPQSKRPLPKKSRSSS